MSEAKHTPGPWEYIETLGAEFSQIVGGEFIIAGIPNIGDEETDVNVRLIIAAPDLLVACQKALGWLLIGAPHANDRGHLLTDQLSAAIAKALAMVTP